MQRFTWLFAVLALCLAAPLLAQAQPAASPNATPLEGAADRSQNDLRWAPCPENAAVECATLILPVDYARPRGATFELAVVRARALNPAERIGSLFVHPGTRASGVRFVLNGAVAPGQSGLPASPHYDDLFARWQSGSYLPMGGGADEE